MWTERVDGCIKRNMGRRVWRYLCVVPIVTSVEFVAGELGKNLHAGSECHSALKENIRICFSKVGFFINSQPKRRLSRMARAYMTIRLELGDDKASAP